MHLTVMFGANSSTTHWQHATVMAPNEIYRTSFMSAVDNESYIFTLWRVDFLVLDENFALKQFGTRQRRVCC